MPERGQIALRLAVTRTKNAFWGLCQPDAALATVKEAREVLTSEPLAEEVAADEAAIWMFSGYPLRALEVLRSTGLDVPLILVSGTVGEEATSSLRPIPT